MGFGKSHHQSDKVSLDGIPTTYHMKALPSALKHRPDMHPFSIYQQGPNATERQEDGMVK